MRARKRSPVHLAAALLFLLPSGRAAYALDPVTPAGGDFQLCGSKFRFVGFNTRGMCHYGRNDAVPGSSLSDIPTNLDFCVSAKARVLRLTCAYHGINKITTGDRLGLVLDACQARGIYVIVAFTDYYMNSGLYPQGDGTYYNLPGCCGLTLLNHQWFAGGYTVNYLPQALYLADRFKNHPAIFAWQLGNELRDNASPATFLAFAHGMATQLRAADPNHMLSVGLIGYRNASLTFAQARQLYADFDFVSTHTYDGDDSNNDADVADDLGKPYVIGEAAFSGTTDRTPLTNADIQKWIARGVDGYMHWALAATSYNNGDADAQFGIDRVFHNFDFEAYRSLYAAWGNTLAPTTLSVAPSSITRTVLYGDPLTPSSTTVRTIAGSTPFTAQASASWLTVVPGGGSATCGGTAVSLEYATTALPPGTHGATVQFTPAPPLTGATLQITVTIQPGPADFDADGDVDQSDFAHLQRCLSGGGVAQLAPQCQSARLDGDSDVDEADFQKFLQCLSGPDIPANAHCLE